MPLFAYHLKSESVRLVAEVVAIWFLICIHFKLHYRCTSSNLHRQFNFIESYLVSVCHTQGGLYHKTSSHSEINIKVGLKNVYVKQIQRRQ